MASQAATVGALSVIIGGDAAALDRVLKGAATNIDSFAKRVASTAGGVGLVKIVEDVANSLVNTVKQGLDAASSIAKMSEASGVSAEQLSKLKYAADISGVASDGLGKAMQSLSVGISDLASGKVSPAADALDKMGISARNADGSIKTSGEVVGEIADKFARYKDGANKAALAQDIFQSGGEAMIPLLNKGRDGFNQLGDEAAKFGLVLDGEAKTAVLEMNTNIAKLNASKQGLALTIAKGLAPAFSIVTSAMLQVKEKSTLVENAAELAGTAMKYLAMVGLSVVTVFDRVTSSIGDLFTAARQLMRGDFAGAWNTITTSAGKSKDSALALAGAVSDLYNGVKRGANDTGKAITDQIEAPARKATEAVRGVLDLFLDNQAKRTAGLNAEADAVGKTADVQARLRIEYEAEALAKAKGIKNYDEYIPRVRAAGDAAAEATQKLAAAQLKESLLMPWDVRARQVSQYTAMLKDNRLTTDEFALALQKVQFPAFTSAAIAASDFRIQIDQLATSAINGLASSLASVITGAKSAAEAFAAFGKQVITQLIEMVIKAIAFKVVMSALGFAGGGPVGMDQSLSSTGLGGGGIGGLYAGGGFTGFGGRNVPAGIVHKGEVVFSQDDVAAWGGVANVESLRRRRGAGYADGVAAGSAPASTTIVHQFDTSSLPNRARWTGDEVIELIDQVNFWIGQGYNLKGT